MDELRHRYRMWELTGKGRLKPADPSPSRQISELARMMALYDYRPLIEAELRGTCGKPNGSVVNCKTTTISPSAVHLVYEPQPASSPDVRQKKQADDMAEGSAIHLQLDKIGAFHGVVASKRAEGIQVAVDRKCETSLRDKLAHMAAKHAVSMDSPTVANSNITGIEPSIKRCSFFDHTGTLRQGTIVSISQVDALIRGRIIPPVGSFILFNGATRHSAKVIRTFEMGFSVKFCTAIHPDELASGASE